MKQDQLQGPWHRAQLPTGIRIFLTGHCSVLTSEGRIYGQKKSAMDLIWQEGRQWDAAVSPEPPGSALKRGYWC